MKTTIIYHKATETADCPDGIMSAAIAAATLATDSFDLLGDLYRKGDDYEAVPPYEKYSFGMGDRLIIVDFSYPKHWLDYWVGQGIDLTIIDHHAAKFPMLEGFTGAILDEKECGATLSWKHFFPDRSLPQLLIHVRRRDIGLDGYYQGLARESEAINEGLSTWRYQFQDTKLEMLADLGNILFENDPSFIQELQETGELRLVKRDELIETVAARSQLRELDGYIVPFVKLAKNEARYYSMIGSVLARTHPDSAFAWIETPDSRQHLRSTGFDVRAIAEKYGGGGHPTAAGFEF